MKARRVPGGDAAVREACQRAIASSGFAFGAGWITDGAASLWRRFLGRRGIEWCVGVGWIKHAAVVAPMLEDWPRGMPEQRAQYLSLLPAFPSVGPVLPD